MRAVFAYDHRFRRAPDGRMWTTGALSASVWQRYLKVFDELVVVARDGGQVDEGDDLARSDTAGVSFTLLESISGLPRLTRYSRVARQMEDVIRRSDAVIARLPSEFGLLACSIAERLGKPYLVEVVGSAYDALAHHGSRVAKAYAPVAERRLRKAVGKARYVIYVTEKWLQSQYPSKHPEFVHERSPLGGGVQVGVTDALLNLPGERVAASVTKAAVVLPEREVRAHRQQRLATLAEGRRPVLGTIGSLATRYKGIQIAIPALAELRQRGLDFEYHILGGGDPRPWQDMIDQHGLTERCFLDGVLQPGPKVLEWLDGIDIYLQPSLQEGLPRAVLEAMSRGLPCVGSSVGGLPELIATGFTHPPGDWRTFANQLEQLLAAPGEVARLSALSFERIGDYAPEIVEGKREAMLRLLRVRAEHQCGAVFVHDHVFRHGTAGEIWTTGAHSRSLWNRYLRYFGHLTVVGRDGGVVETAPELARADCNHVSFRLLPNINGFRQSWRRLHVRRQLRKIVASSTVVIARLPSELGLIACDLAHRLRKPLVVEVVGSAKEALSNHGRLAARAYAPLAERRTRRAVQGSPFVVYVTRSWLQGLYPSRNPQVGEGAATAQAAIPDAVIALPDDAVRKARLQRLREMQEGPVPVFGTIASLSVRYKGLETAIRAFATLKREGHTFTYRILGPGDPAPWQRLIEELGLDGSCHFDGPRPAGEAIIEWLDGVDVHVQPSLTESLGRAQIEAMSRGVACISSNAGGLAEYGDPQWQHAPGDVEGLTDLLRKLMQQPALIASLSERAFAQSRRFDPTAIDAEWSKMMAVVARASTHS